MSDLYGNSILELEFDGEYKLFEEKHQYTKTENLSKSQNASKYQEV